MKLSRPRILLLSVVFMLMNLGGLIAQAQQKPNPPASTKLLNYGATLDFNSRYVWRGIPFSQGAVLQPTAWLEVGHFHFDVWGNILLQDSPDSKNLNEIDLNSLYRFRYRWLDIEPALRFYFFPNQTTATTGEVALRLKGHAGPVEIFTDQTFGFLDISNRYYGDVGIGYLRTLEVWALMETSLSLGWGNSRYNQANIGVSKAAFEAVTVSLAFTFFPEKFFFVRPHFDLSIMLDPELRSQLDDATVAVVGLGLGVKF